MNGRPTCVAHRFLFFPLSVYLESDRVDVGTTNVVCQEEMQRMAYRDVRRLVAWEDSVRLYMWIGIVATLVAVVFGLMVGLLGGLASGSGKDVIVVTAVLAGGAFLVGVVSLYAGRPRGITRLRIEGVHGHIDAVLSGRLQKREKVLAELARRIRERQTVG